MSPYMSPRVSIGIPAYNRPSMLRQAIQAVLDQTFQDFEIVVSDDGSASDAAEVVRSFGDPRVAYRHNDPPLGVPPNWNECVRLSKGEFFALLPDDDLYMPSFLASTTHALDVNADVGFAMSGYYSVDEDLRPLHAWLVRPSAFTLKGEAAVAFLLATMLCLPCTLLFRRSAILEVGPWREHFWDDWSLIIAIAFHKGFTFVPELLACNRYHAKNLSRVLGVQGRDEVADLINQTFALFGSTLPVTEPLLALRARSNRELSHACILKAFKAMSRGHFREAAFHYRRARHLYPLAGLHPGFVNLWRKHRVHARRVEDWESGRRLRAEPVLPVARTR